jgi:DNA-directed RNA polymerase specialized sigma24 family protein
MPNLENDNISEVKIANFPSESTWQAIASHQPSVSRVDDSLAKLIAETCQHPPGSLKRQLGLERIVRLIIQSGRLWTENAPYYEDALQQTWLYFCRNLCEATTTKEPYDPQRSNIFTWLDRYLKGRLKDMYLKNRNEQIIHVENPEEIILTIPAPVNTIPLEDQIRAWAEADATGELVATHIANRPELNCQLLILRRLPPKSQWEELAAEFNISMSTLNSFYRRKCIPHLQRNFEPDLG